jgi:two-component system chemotaxis sensor kinase CheA
MRRVIRDMCAKTGKEAELVAIGEGIEADKRILDGLSEPLMHIVRNAMDHGIESPEERAAVGKPAKGHVTLEARIACGSIIVTVSDDGRGLAREKILKKAAERGLLTRPEAEYADREVYNFILLPGFTTKDAVTEFSGRGVGLDAALRSIRKLGGTITLESAPGRGVRTVIRIPQTPIAPAFARAAGDSIDAANRFSDRSAFSPLKTPGIYA